ncbi:uncharacterized protein MONOS_17183 [Monocercomonoides exilis]|uniref:uncharacterized protein n=1 Tax=Monocercomonoides exilis TaxID=2049356 RepID=UPI00355A32EF|nr:hypothetical protein MONOS_17183 [Monocercomonoides exilis]
MRNAILLLKHVGYCNVLKSIWICSFKESPLNKIFEKMIIEEEKKKEEKDEKHLADLYECFISLSFDFPQGLILMCVSCLLKVALKKEEDEETQKEVEMALLALSCIYSHYEIEQKQYLNEIKEIIQYHQEHHNLTRLAYLYAWEFLIFRLDTDKSLNEVIVNELYFGREARRELKELSKCVDWKRKEERRGEKEGKEEYILIEGLQYESVELISSITQIYRAATDNREDIDMLKGGAVDAVLEGLQRHTFKGKMAYESL